jgi:hypothetical protein
MRVDASEAQRPRGLYAGGQSSALWANFASAGFDASARGAGLTGALKRASNRSAKKCARESDTVVRCAWASWLSKVWRVTMACRLRTFRPDRAGWRRP